MEIGTIYDLNDNIIGVFKTGSAWRKEPRERLGSYDYGSVGNIYDNEDHVVATFETGKVFNVAGKSIGSFKKMEIVINGVVVGKYDGCDGVAAAGIAFLFR